MGQIADRDGRGAPQGGDPRAGDILAALNELVLTILRRDREFIDHRLVIDPLDVEEGAEGILRRHRPLIMVELRDIPSMVRQMRPFGYLPYEREGSRIRPLRDGHYNLYFAHESMLDAYDAGGLIAG